MTAKHLEELLGNLQDGRMAGGAASMLAMWRAARDDARTAYTCWRQSGGRAAFVAYQAAEDRADAALAALRSTITK
jgi:hypothetical protein